MERNPIASPEPSFSHYPAWPAPVPLRLATLMPHPCGYLPGRAATFRAFSAAAIDGSSHEKLMDAGFRRAGRLFYQPACLGCRACTPIRVPVARFRASRSQRRCWKRNADLQVAIGKPTLDDERTGLYAQYQMQRHLEPTAPDRSELYHFLYDSPLETVEVCIRDASRRLLAVGICDVGPNSLSTVYCYYDLSQPRRGLGTLTALVEIEHARRLGLTFYYLGYWVSGCRAMEYKRTFRPFELLGTDGTWRAPDA